MKNIAVGILAHVDAGKTTLSEGLLYSCGATARLGRVDKRDAFLDNHSLERERGITIFSHQAILDKGDTRITLIDTPGHIDFSCEAERAISVQDYAILVISATDGVTANTKTLWHLLASKKVPTFIFVNKLDIADRTRAQLLSEVSTVLSPHCVDFTTDTGEAFYESCAASDERLMEEFFSSDCLSVKDISLAISKRKIFPVYFGSALKMRGVEEFLEGIDKYTLQKNYSESVFGAKVYKISRDAQGKRLSYVKITGGSLRPKDVVEIVTESGECLQEKVEEIRLYSGERYKTASSAGAGTVCALLGLNSTRVGMGLGFEMGDSQTLTPDSKSGFFFII